MLRPIFPFAFIFLFSNTYMAQNDNSLQKVKTISFFTSVSQSKIVNTNYSKDEYVEIRYPASPNFGFSYTKYFNDNAGITTGLEYSNYKNFLSCNIYHKSTTTKKDFFDDDYYTITLGDYEHKREMHTIEIPVLFHFEDEISSKACFFGDIGIKIHSSLKATKGSSGTITTMGYYQHPQFSNVGILVSDDPYYDWGTKNQSSSTGYEYANLSFSVFLNTGIFIPINDRLQFMSSVYYAVGLTDINDTEKDDPYKNVLGEESEYKPSKIKAAGLRIGISIPLYVR